MGIYIKDKDMEMPKNCGYCKLHRLLYHTQFCVILDKNCSPWKERKAWCPLTEIPEPHGKLIDVDALVEDLELKSKELFRIDAVSPDDYWINRQQAYNEALFKIWVETFIEYLKSRPTIIEAEE